MDLGSTTKLLVAGAAATLGICELCRQPDAGLSRAPAPATAVVGTPVATSAPPRAGPDAGQPATVTLRITGMTCGGCTVATRNVLLRLDGVASVDISYERARAVVIYDATRVTHARMIEAVKTLGYAAIVVPAPSVRPRTSLPAGSAP